MNDSLNIGKAWGEGHYAKLSKNDRALIAFGMTNITIIEQAEHDLSDWLGMYPAEKSEVMRGVTLGLMEAAKKCGMMRA